MLQRIRAGLKDGRRSCFWGMGLCAVILVSSAYPILYWRNITHLKAQVAALTARVERLQTHAHPYPLANQDQRFLQSLRKSLLLMPLHTQGPCSEARMAHHMAWLATHLPVKTHPQWQMLAHAMQHEAHKVPQHSVCVMSDVLQTTQAMLQWLARSQSLPQQRPVKFLGMDWSKWVAVRTRPEISQTERTLAYVTLQQLQWAARLGQSALYRQTIDRLKTLSVFRGEASMQKAVRHLDTLHVAKPMMHHARLIQIIDALLATSRPLAAKGSRPQVGKHALTKAEVLEKIRASERRFNTQGVVS